MKDMSTIGHKDNNVPAPEYPDEVICANCGFGFSKFSDHPMETASGRDAHFCDASCLVDWKIDTLTLENTALRAALEEARAEFASIAKLKWGWDGDQGVKSRAEFALDAIAKALAAQ